MLVNSYGFYTTQNNNSIRFGKKTIEQAIEQVKSSIAILTETIESGKYKYNHNDMNARLDAYKRQLADLLEQQSSGRN